MNLLIGLTRLRVALLVAGLAWFLGLTPSLPVRIAIGALVLVALVFDGLTDDQRIKHAAKVPPPRDRFHTAV